MLEFYHLEIGSGMRIEFPTAAREDFHWSQAQLRIGSAPENDLVLDANQSSPHHLRIEQDRRGLLLHVLPSAERIHVNARPVRECALLRAGDVISVGDCRMLLRDEASPSVRAPLPPASHTCCTVALRAVAGPLSGRVIPLGESIELGPPGRCPLELPLGEKASVRLFWEDGRLWLNVLDVPARYPLRVNGVVVRKLPLHPGDQIGLAKHRFVLDAPGMKPEPEIIMPTAAILLPEQTAGPSGEVWWLIVTAAVLALAIALALLLHF